MINIVFFARVREELGCDSLSLDLSPEMSSVGKVREVLMRRGPNWERVLSEENIVAACNHEVVDDSHIVQVGDEVAFYPPVTGG